MRRALGIAMTVGLLAGFTVASSGRAATRVELPLCFWDRPVGADVVNVLYPDAGAAYWRGTSVIPPGGEVVLRGRFPHARYMSFNLYDEQLRPVDGLADVEIVPDPGSTNPFVEGADRRVEDRSYTIRVRWGPRPADPAPNTVYASLAGRGAPWGLVMLYRVYLPDTGRDLSGGVGLPSAELHTAGGGLVVDQTAACNPANATTPALALLGGLPLQRLLADGDLPGVAGLGFPARDPVRWERFFGLPHLQVALHASPGGLLRQVGDRLLADDGGGYLSNRDNAYVTALGNRAHGEVLVVTGSAPTSPSTLDGDPVMGGGQVRYWSFCTNERLTTRWLDCAFDEDAVLDEEGRYTFVVSSPADRPDNATAACGVTWLRWGTSPETMLILRHMLPGADFDHAIQRVRHPAELASVMGDHLPVGRHTSIAAFERRGCPAT